MYLGINQEENRLSKSQSQKAHKITDYLKTEFENQFYGEGVQCCLCVLNCVSFPGFDHDFETGAIIHKKYTKSQKYLVFSFKLSHKEVAKADDESEIISIIEEGILKSFAEIGNTMKIADFDFTAFYTDLKNILLERKWQNPDYVFKEVPFPDHLFKTTKKIPKMKEDNFWELIKFSKSVSTDSYDHVKKIGAMLLVYPKKDIIGFEHTLRLALQQLNTFNVLALDTIMNEGTTDDGFLMFRLSIIQAGKEAFEKAIKHTDDFDVELGESHDKLLGLSDIVFIKKMGKDTEEELPRSICDEAEIYEDMGTTGEDWNEKDLPVRFPKLWKKYKG